MKNFLALLVSVLAVAAAGFVLCAAVGWNARPVGMALAAVAALVAGGVAFVPLILARGASQAAVAQAALLGTMIHLLGCLAGAAVMLLVVRMPAATYWILAFYWATLVALVAGFTRAVKAAPPTATGYPARPTTPNPKQ
jgi:hypothetical protein